MPEEPTRAGRRVQRGGNTGRPYWHIEKARIDGTQKIPVELVVNGEAVAGQEIVADGTVRNVSFNYPIEQSSWVALRVHYAAHTNPIYVTVADAPIRANKRSTQWCLDAVDRCWEMKKPRIRDEDLPAAEAAYDAARARYSDILSDYE